MMTEETPSPEHGIDPEAAALAKAIEEAEAAAAAAAESDLAAAVAAAAAEAAAHESNAAAITEEDIEEITELSESASVSITEIISESEVVVDGSLLYDSQTTAEMAGIPTDLLALYVKLGFVETAEDCEQGTDAGAKFDDEALYVLRRIADLRYEHGVNLKGIGMVLSLLRQVQRLEAELRFLRGQ